MVRINENRVICAINFEAKAVPMASYDFTFAFLQHQKTVKVLFLALRGKGFFKAADHHSKPWETSHHRGTRNCQLQQQLLAGSEVAEEWSQVQKSATAFFKQNEDKRIR